MKDTMKSLFGATVLSIPKLIQMGLIFVPLQYLGFPWWADAIIALSTLLFNLLGGLIYAVVWIWSFIIFVQSPFTAYSVIYLVFLALYLFLVVGLRLIAAKRVK